MHAPVAASQMGAPPLQPALAAHRASHLWFSGKQAWPAAQSAPVLQASHRPTTHRGAVAAQSPSARHSAQATPLPQPNAQEAFPVAQLPPAVGPVPGPPVPEVLELPQDAAAITAATAPNRTR
jgi:hypothetical protein